MTVPIAVDPASNEALFIPITFQGIDSATLLTYSVSVAFMPPGVEPGPSDFHAASWASDGSTTVTVLVGPSNGVTFAAGASYGIYVKVVGGGLAPIFYAGAIVTGAGSSYSGSPTANTVDAVRFWLQDTTSPYLMSDDEITFALAASGSAAGGTPILAAAVCADVLAGRYARDYTEATIDDVRTQFRDRWKSMIGLADRLRQLAATDVGGAAPINMGLADPSNVDGTATVPAFWRGMHDNPEGHHPDIVFWPSPWGAWGYFGGN
jgi:hypothetical protein